MIGNSIEKQYNIPVNPPRHGTYYFTIRLYHGTDLNRASQPNRDTIALARRARADIQPQHKLRLTLVV